MKKKENRVMSFRFGDHVLEKIDYLMEEDKKKLEKMGIKPKTRKELVEGIIEDYYLRYITKSRDPDVVNRIASMVDDVTETRFKGIEDKIDELLFLAVKNDIGNKVLYRSPSVLPAPHNKKEAIDIFKESSRWNDALDEYLVELMKRKPISSYLTEDDEEYDDDDEEYDDDDEDRNGEESDDDDEKEEMNNRDHNNRNSSSKTSLEEYMDFLMKGGR